MLDSIHENGAKLVQINDDEMADFKFSYPGLRMIPEKFYSKTPIEKARVEHKAKKNEVTNLTEVLITDKNGNKLPGIDVIAFTDFAGRVGASGKTNASGKVSLRLPGKKIERLYVDPKHSYWGYYQSNFTIPASYAIKLDALDVNYTNSLRHLVRIHYKPLNLKATEFQWLLVTKFAAIHSSVRWFQSNYVNLARSRAVSAFK